MALTGEDLAEISKLLDVKFESELAPIKKDIKNIKHALETDKKIQLSAENYVPAASRFEEASCKINSMQSDINLLKKNSHRTFRKNQKISVGFESFIKCKAVKFSYMCLIISFTV